MPGPDRKHGAWVCGWAERALPREASCFPRSAKTPVTCSLSTEERPVLGRQPSMGEASLMTLVPGCGSVPAPGSRSHPSQQEASSRADF